MDEADAVEVLSGDEAGAPVVLTCEHASQRMPAPWEWPEADRWLVGTHWAYDIGAAELTAELARALGASAVSSRFTRLLCDPNRDESDPTLFREVADGHPVELNRALSLEERARRVERLWRPYHAAVDRTVRESSAPLVLAVHTFTPVYEGETRELELGVLFDAEEELATDLALALRRERLVVDLNEPYSGRAGLIYSADRHARAHARRALEIEVRQDLAVEEVFRRRLLSVLSAWLPRAAAALRT